MRSGMVVGSIVSLMLAAAPLRGEVHLDLLPVESESGETFYLAEAEADHEDRLVRQALVLLDAASENQHKQYSIALVHVPDGRDETSLEASFEVVRAGPQCVAVKLPSPLPVQAQWWLRLDGEKPLPVARRLWLREKTDEKSVSPVVQAPVVPSQQASPSDTVVVAGTRYYVTRPAKVTVVPRHRIVRVPKLRARRVRPLPPPGLKKGPRHVVPPRHIAARAAPRVAPKQARPAKAVRAKPPRKPRRAPARRARRR